MGHPLTWSSAQDDVLRAGYATAAKAALIASIEKLCGAGRAYSWNAIVGRANRLGLQRSRDEAWTATQLDCMRRNYAKLSMSDLLASLARGGPPRTARSVHKKASEMGLSRPMSPPPPGVGRKRSPAAARPARSAPTPTPVPAPKVPPMQFLRGATPPPYRAPAITAQPAADAGTDIAHAKLEAAQARARQMLSGGAEPWHVGTQTRLPMREVYRLVGEVREAKRAQRSAA